MPNEPSNRPVLSRIVCSVILTIISSGLPVGESLKTKYSLRPNILFVMSDDHTTQAFGVYGSRLASLNPTPNIDRLAHEGMLFTNVFCNNSICTPSRASILTGQYPQTNGVIDLSGSLGGSRQYLPRELNKLGYDTALVGKWHLKEEPSAFDYYSVLPGQGQYFDPVFRVRGEEAWPEVTIQKKGHSSDIITQLGLDWLETKWDRQRPFFLMHHFKAPHDMFEFAPRYAKYLAETEIPEPSSLYSAGNHGSVATRGFGDELVHRIGASVSRRNVIRNMGMHMGISQAIPDPEYAHLAYQEYLKRYLRCVKGVDDNMKRLYDYLEREGLLENTIIIYTGDQGFMLGEHDFIDKRWMYEESMRMPFLVRYSKMVEAGSRADLLVNNTDFAPTLIELAGGEVPQYMQGASFRSVLETGKEPDNWRTSTYYRYWMHMAHRLGNPAHFGIRNQRYKLIFYYGLDYRNPERVETDQDHRRDPQVATPPAWEFYDLQNDPHEMDNRYNDDGYMEVISSLKRELRRLREELNETDDRYPHLQAIISRHWNQ